MRRFLYAFCACLWFVPSAHAEDSAAAPLRIIVDRMPTSVELFLRLPAQSVEAVLGGSVQPLMNADGSFDLGVFRSSGTAEQGDGVLHEGFLQVGDATVALPAMSVMLHPDTLPMPFDTPIDGVAAMSICTVPPGAQAPAPAGLTLYGGYIAYPVNGGERITLRLASAAPQPVELIEYVDGRKTRELRQVVAPGDVITLEAVRTGRDALMARLGYLAGISLLFGGVALAGGLWLVAKRRAKARANGALTGS